MNKKHIEEIKKYEMQCMQTIRKAFHFPENKPEQIQKNDEYAQCNIRQPYNTPIHKITRILLDN